MTQKKHILALALMLVIAVSFIAVMQLAKDVHFNFDRTAPSVTNHSPNNELRFLTAPAFSSQPTFEVIRTAPSPLIGNSTRAEIYDFVVGNPGIQFRGICTGLSIAVGTAEFHLGVLRKAGLISFVRDGKYKRFFATKKFSVKEMKLIALLRHQTIRKILKTLTRKKSMSHCKLASALSITSQGLTWQMNRLKKEGVIEESWVGIKVAYSLSEVHAQVLPELLWIVER